MAGNDLGLTELILCIQHEVQSAVDYIAAQAGEATELGRSGAVMAVESLRVKLPVDTAVLRTRARAAPASAPAATPTGTALSSALAQRKGLALDIGKPGGMATWLKLKVDPDAPAAPASGDGATARAEIEITFAPLQRPG